MDSKQISRRVLLVVAGAFLAGAVTVAVASAFPQGVLPGIPALLLAGLAAAALLRLWSLRR